MKPGIQHRLFSLAAPLRSGLDGDENLHPNFHDTRASARGPQLVELRAADSVRLAELGDRECRSVLSVNCLYTWRFDAMPVCGPDESGDMLGSLCIRTHDER